MTWLKRGQRVGSEREQLDAESQMRETYNLRENLECLAVYVGPRVVKVLFRDEFDSRLQFDHDRASLEAWRKEMLS